MSLWRDREHIEAALFNGKNEAILAALWGYLVSFNLSSKGFHRMLLVLTGCLSLQAMPALAQAGWSAPVAVSSINARDIATDVFVPAFNNPASCSNGQFFRIANDISNGDMMRATVLTAFATGKPVRVWVHACASDGPSIVSAVWMAP